MINDMYQLCQFYVKREKLNTAYKDALDRMNPNESNQQTTFDEYNSRFDQPAGAGRSFNSSSRNRSFSSFLS